MLTRLQQLAFYKRLKTFLVQYEQFFVPSLLVLGFVVDVFTFQTLSPKTVFVITGVYAALAGLSIMYSNVYDERKDKNNPRHPIFAFLRVAAAFLEQFTFGALLSSSLLFYWFSGAFSVSWPIMMVLVALIASNEVLRKHYLQPTVHMSVYTFVLFSYFTVLFPFVFHSLNASMFVLGGLVSTVIVLLMVALMVRLKSIVNAVWEAVVFRILIVVVAMNVLYFANIIPPIPLFIRDAGIYQDIQIQGGEYTLIGEQESLLQKMWPGQTIRADEDGRVYAYVAIFAPTELTATIYHQWERYDEVERRWVKSSRLSYQIRGGRQEGFRGYSFKTQVTPGKWRVKVETERGQVLGRLRFTYVE